MPFSIIQNRSDNEKMTKFLSYFGQTIEMSQREKSPTFSWWNRSLHLLWPGVFVQKLLTATTQNRVIR